MAEKDGTTFLKKGGKHHELDQRNHRKGRQLVGGKVTANQPHSNGDNGYTSIVTCLLADSMVKKISKKQVEVFKKNWQ